MPGYLNELIPTADNLLASLFLFGLLFCGACFLSDKTDRQKPELGRESSLGLTGQSFELACLLEDAPETSLRGQFYELATPLMTPLACILIQSWHDFYLQNLKKPGINYWQWRDSPESRNLSQELSWLFDLPEPRGYAKEVLESLGERKDPFFQPRQKRRTNQKYQGKFSHLNFPLQTEMRLAFKQWHDRASRLIGRDSLKAVYQVCYGTTEEIIKRIVEPLEEKIIDATAPWWQVLGVHPSANALQVEEAYKNLICLWHPDLNKHPLATQIASRINIAYGEYQALNKMDSQLMKVNSNLFLKIRGWLKPRLSR